MLKLLIERNGIVFSITTKTRAYFFFASSKLFGMRITPTTDPDLGIVEICGYDISKIVENWDHLSNIKIKRK